MKSVPTTKDKRAKEPLEKSEERARLIFENMRDTAWLMDMNFKTTWASPSTVHTRGFKPEELLGATLDRHMAPASMTRLTELIAKHLSLDNLADKRKEVVIEGDFEFYGKDGTAFWGDTVATLLRKMDGAPLGFLFVVRDVTGRKRAEEALSRKQIMLARTEGIAHVGSWEWDIEKDKVTWSDELFRIFQRDPLEGAPSFTEHPAFYHPDDMARLQQAVEVAVADGTPYELELRAIRKDGEIRACMARGVAEMAPGGGAVRLFGSLQDITERKRAEEMLAKSEKRFRQLSELLPEMVFETDSKGNLTFANKYGIKLFGYSDEEFQSGVNAFALFAPEDREGVQRRFREIMSGSETDVREFQGIRKDGNKFPLLVHATTVFEEGVPIGIRGIAIDITGRKRKEATIQASELRYRQLVENASEAIIVAQDGLLKFINRATCEMIGYSETELISRPFPEFVHPDDREKVVDNYQKRVAGEMAQARYVFRLLTRDGGVKWVEIGAVLIDWEGRPATLNFLTDITDRHRGEESIQASLREKEVMLREIHHRVKNNMQVISSLFNLQAGKTANPEYREILKEGQTRIRAMSLVHEKLYQSRDLSKIDLAVYIQSLAAHLFNVYLTDPNQIRLETDFEEVRLGINSAIPCGLILNELISNSLKHAFPEGRKGLIRIGLKHGPDDMIILRVADDGIELPKDLDFRQSESLGLQITNLLVRQLEGSIELDRTNGTAFIVTFREMKYAPRS